MSETTVVDVDRTSDDLERIYLWIADVCYPPTIKIWYEDEVFGYRWRRASDQPNWKGLSFDDWAEKFADMQTESNCEDGTEFVISRPSFQGWTQRAFKTWTINGECQHWNCNKPATSRIAWNCHGTCSEAHVCSEHRSRSGVWADSL